MPYGIYQHYRGKKCPSWKGDKIGKKGIHDWVRSIKPKVTKCEFCKQFKTLELSSKDHNYTRNPKDYRWLCRSCHRLYDIKYNGYIVNKSPKRPECWENTPCVICGNRFIRLKSKKLKTCSGSCGTSLGHKSRVSVIKQRINVMRDGLFDQY